MTATRVQVLDALIQLLVSDTPSSDDKDIIAAAVGLLQVWVSAPGAEMRDVRGLHSVFVSAPQPLTRQMIFLRTFVQAR